MNEDMAMRKKIIGSSWKMHINSINDATNLAKGICEKVGDTKSIDIFLIPTYPLIPIVSEIIKNSNIQWGAQNVCHEEKGAFTGEVPINILKELGCQYIEVGHAERKLMFNENDYKVNQKIKLCEKYDMTPIVCIGETKDEYYFNVGRLSLKTQVLWALEGISDEFKKKVVLAYEPVWAIGQSEAANFEYVQNTHRYIRNIIKDSYGSEVSQSIRIIYGGSVSKQNSKQLINQEDVDGLFIGRFGLDADNFKSIVNSAR